MNQLSMKHLLLLLCFLSFYGTSSAQTNSYLQNNPQWVVLLANGFNYPCIVYDSMNYYLNGDSVINSLQYKQLYKCGSAWSSWQSPQPNTGCNLNYTYCDTTPVGFLRSQGLQMYFIPNGDTSEQLLYDFNLTVGSQLPQTYAFCCPGASVTSIDSIYTPYGYRKRFWVNNGTEYLVEGIGSYYGLIEQWGPQLDHTNQLVCYGLNDTAWFPGQGPYCSVITEVSNHEQVDGDLQLYPNPVSTQVTITANISGALQMTDVLGNIVFASAFTGRQEINLSGFAKGIYFIRVRNDEQQIATQLIVQ